MNLHDPTHVLLLAVFLAGFLAGVVFAGFIFELEVRKWRKRHRPFVGFDSGAGDSCTVIGHYSKDGHINVDHVEFHDQHHG